MIIHSLFTDGYYPWAELFLESFKFYNGTNNLVILDAFDISSHQEEKLKSIYSNLVLNNHSLDLETISEKLGLSKQNLLKYKKELETNNVNDKNKILKMVIAADLRVTTLRNMMHEWVLHPNTSPDTYITNFDVDLYVKNSLDELFNFIEAHDISIRLRLKSKPNRRTMIGIQGYKINEKSLNFLDNWLYQLRLVHPVDRSLGFGQTSCYYSYEEYKDKVKWGDVPRKFLSPQMNQDDFIWSANTPEGKTANLKKCRRDFEKCKEQF